MELDKEVVHLLQYGSHWWLSCSLPLTILAPLSMSFADPWGDIFEERNADSFVDDTSNGCNDAHLEIAMPFEELIAHGQACAQIWEQNIIQLGRCAGTEEVFLVHGVLAVGEWSSSDGSNNILSWNYCPNTQEKFPIIQ